MVNTRSKGDRLELKAKKELEAEGYNVLKKIHTRWSPGDFFGLFDLLAMSDKDIKLVQVTCNGSKSSGFKERVMQLKCPLNVSKEIWIWKDRIGWIKYVWFVNMWIKK